MERTLYVITRIEGEYAYLREKNDASSDEIFIAMALLPDGCDIGTCLYYEASEFTEA